ncbi:class I SAM-dependent methyltransferase [Hyphococcus sp. DH-69]|uniref:class I SAM-dependent methyltransferase n=1 Tax=Hyphococcus formosus TaxID=3143534 RepID=UPI00398B7C56
MNPQPGPDLLSQYYTDKYDPYEADHGLTELDAEIEAAKAKGEFRHIKITPGLRILDVGCGGGAFLRVAKALGAVVQGVEPSEFGVATARKSGIPVFHGQLDEYINSEGCEEQFDVVTSNHVVEHHPDPVRLLGEMRSLLAPSGYVWFGVPNADSRTARKLKKHWHANDLPYHLMQFTPSSAALAVEKAGMSIRRQYTTSLPTATMASLYDIWRYRYFIPRKVTQKLPFLRPLGVRVSKDMDAKGEGEAIIIEAVA